MKKVLITVISICLVAALGITAALYTSSGNDAKTLPEAKDVSFLMLDFPIFDFNNTEEYIGYSDYVFVGKVEAISERGEYGDKYYPNGKSELSEKSSSPYTSYSVSVKENIKGALKTDSPISVTKHAGVSDKTGTMVIVRYDMMPTVGEEYIFLTRATEDGRLVIIDPCGNIPLSKQGNNPVTGDNYQAEPVTAETTTDTYPSEQTSSDAVTMISIENQTADRIIERYRDAYRNEKDPLSSREKFTSVYDIED